MSRLCPLQFFTAGGIEIPIKSWLINRNGISITFFNKNGSDRLAFIRDRYSPGLIQLPSAEEGVGDELRL